MRNSLSFTTAQNPISSILRDILNPKQGNMVDFVSKVNLTISHDNVERDVKQLMKELRPSWNPADIKFKHFTEGLTNIIVGCFVDSDPKDIVLVRLYGQKTELLIDRDMEIKNMMFLHSEGCAAQPYCLFNNGLAYEFFPGIAIDADMVRDPKLGKLIAKAIAKMHAIPSSNGVKLEPVLFPTIQKFISLMPLSFDDPEKNKRLHQDFLSKSELEKELLDLENQLIALKSPIVFCHNDILCKNIIYNEEKELVSLIDYEYAGYSFQAFDIGNHFCEWAGIDEVDYARYPSKDLQIPWLRAYLNHFNHNLNKNEVTDDEVEKFYVTVNKFALAAHFMWGTWSLVQSRISTIDFDFLDYAKIRLGEYFKKRDEFLALKYP